LMQLLHIRLTRTAKVTALIVCCWAASASAALQVYEGFQYADGTSIVGQNGGGGWSNSWNATGTITGSTLNATAPGLTYPNLPALGNKLTIAGQQTATGNANNGFLFRTFGAATTFGADGTTAWISMIGQRTGAKSGVQGVGGAASYQRIFGVSFFNAGTANTNERFSIGELSSSATVPDTDMWALNIFNPSGAGEIQPSTTPIDQQSFLLVRLNYGAGALADNAYLWVNPNLSLGEPTIGSAQASLLGRNLEFDRLRVSAGGSNSSTEQPNGAILAASGLLDEIRVGTSFASVIGPGLIPGDVNGDFVINSNDYHIIRDNFQMASATRAQGDLNGDGFVNFTDFRIWKNNRSPGSGAEVDFLGGAVPEPASIAIVLIVFFAFSLKRFNRQAQMVCTSSHME
jgi:Dockerin type I domain